MKDNKEESAMHSSLIKMCKEVISLEMRFRKLNIKRNLKAEIISQLEHIFDLAECIDKNIIYKIYNFEEKKLNEELLLNEELGVSIKNRTVAEQLEERYSIVFGFFSYAEKYLYGFYYSNGKTQPNYSYLYDDNHDFLYSIINDLDLKEEYVLSMFEDDNKKRTEIKNKIHLMDGFPNLPWLEKKIEEYNKFKIDSYLVNKDEVFKFIERQKEVSTQYDFVEAKESERTESQKIRMRLRKISMILRHFSDFNSKTMDFKNLNERGIRELISNNVRFGVLIDYQISEQITNRNLFHLLRLYPELSLNGGFVKYGTIYTEEIRALRRITGNVEKHNVQDKKMNNLTIELGTSCFWKKDYNESFIALLDHFNIKDYCFNENGNPIIKL